jgi:HD-like signal output (HDOD) protein
MPSTLTPSGPTAPAARSPFLRTVAGWAALFDPSDLPVLASTVERLAEAREREDFVDAHGLAQLVSADPLMTLKLLSHVGWLRRGREGGEPETVTAALVMLGITPFFKHFASVRSVDEQLARHAGAQAGFDAVLDRSHRASSFATAFAAQRLDHDVAVIGSAALLHDFAELLLWLSVPEAASAMRERQLQDSGLRSTEVQKEVLGITLSELQHELMVRWRLPKLLSQIADDTHHNDSAQVRNVVLAVRLARHTVGGWDNPALPDDVRDIAELLHLGIEPTQKLLLDLVA